MDVREKLVEIVCDSAQINGCIHSCNHPPCAMVSVIVDALIENGVTVQEWISVTERLPEREGTYITMTKESGVVPQRYVVRNGVGKWQWNGRYSTWTVTHWMPMPEPPKGE